MGKSQRDKGYRTENNLRLLLNDYEIKSRRIPLSGAAPNCPGDLAIEIEGKEKLAEVKCRADGFKQIYKWLAENDFLFLKADCKDFLVVLKLEDFIQLLREKVNDR